MDWERIKTKLEHILNAPLRFEKINQADWYRIADSMISRQSRTSKSIEQDQTVFFFLYKEGLLITALAVEAILFTSAERQLVEMMIEAYRLQEKKPLGSVRSEEESRALLIRSWVVEQLEQSMLNKEMPEFIASQSALYDTRIPLLLYGDYSDNRNVTYQGLKKLLETFFSAEIMLIPLKDKEWLILASEALLTDSDEDKEVMDENNMEETLASICHGLYEMMVSEWVGECHLSIHYPIIPAKSLLGTIVELREAIGLGRTFHVGTNIHLPWLMHLDKLLHAIPEHERIQFIDNVFKQMDHLLDTEMLQTLEHFFELNCNVSETAKRLYIHRNTLLYRLDKFKQETGLDVRAFNHAVLVQIALQLYKVTKRK